MDIQDRIFTEIMATIISQPFFHQLRTVEQLGYITSSFQKNQGPVVGIMFLVQGSKHSLELMSRIENFLIEFRVIFN